MAADENTASPTRTKATWKPRVDEADLRFVRDEQGVVLLNVGDDQVGGGRFREPGRQPIAELPYQPASGAKDPVGEPVPFIKVDDLPEGVEISYQIVGGYNNSALKVFWQLPGMTMWTEPDPDAPRVEWVALKTFTGFQLKYVLPKKKPPLVFAFADEDAYVYCDKDICQECTFLCKRGMVLYVCLSDLGVVRLPIGIDARGATMGSGGERNYDELVGNLNLPSHKI